MRQTRYAQTADLRTDGTKWNPGSERLEGDKSDKDNSLKVSSVKQIQESAALFVVSLSVKCLSQYGGIVFIDNLYDYSFRMTVWGRTLPSVSSC